MSIKTFLITAEDTALAALKSAGTIIENFVISEPQKLIAEAKQLPLGTTIMNLISGLEQLTGSGANKMDVVIGVATTLVQQVQAAGGLKGLVTSAEDFARELGQSLYNDFKAAAKPLVLAAEQKLA